MGEWKGKIVTCDRCGTECRRKFLKDEHCDGGFTVSPRFEPLEDGWKYHYEIGWLCPACEEEFEKTISNFLKTKK